MFVPATVVDHKIPHRLADARRSGNDEQVREALSLFWDRKNWQGLCKTCHDSVKQAQDKSGLAGGCGLDGVPIDANHPWLRDRKSDVQGKRVSVRVDRGGRRLLKKKKK